MMKCKKFLEKVADKANINLVSFDKNGDYGYSIEFEYYSNLGEDVIISLVIDKLSKDYIIQEMSNYVDNFDAEEHASDLFQLRGKYGTPTSLRALLEDADEQAEKLEEIYLIMKGV